ncbi:MULTISPECIES: cell division protein FtsQ/DivIB [unclassified Sphingomonas]|uniref:cell division protein FtsQ/DivIB n=1 Tax=unclassified Sphingomonas TaxID=196159 RepID=UPI00082E7782|nr:MULTISPECIES: cell division protein FtsQ/DivIB [unclassified Sphingomonas]
MTRTATRRASPKRTQQLKRKPQAKRPRRAGVLDHAVAVLPGGEHTARRLAAWSITGGVCALLLAAASWAGIPGAIGVAMAEGIGEAGFRVKEIDIIGLKRMDRNSVYAAALDQQSRAMPLVDLNQVRDRLLEYGWIEEARVSRRLPDRIVIEIVERKPAAVWQHDGQLMLIDMAGVLLEPVLPSAMPELPLVIGEGANAKAPAYEALIDATPALKPLVKAATWVGDRRWNLTFESGEELVLPEGDETARAALIKFAEIDGTQGLLGRGYRRFDMRDPKKLVVRLSGGNLAQTIDGEGL